ncbi:MAG TPA: DUF4838 domain-containing protein, partial [Terrimicrobiaceae bacterium]|nr:DUF4838 domain-containing protein [Terrimicrobiaceae bacterium]
ESILTRDALALVAKLHRDESAIRREEDVDGSVRFLGPDGKAVQKLIWVGNSAAAQRQGITASDLPPGGYRMATTPEGLILTGNDSGDTGTYFAALALLERLGFRWLWPGPLGTVLPSRDAFRVPRFRQQDAPALACRRIRAQSFIPGRSDLGLALLGMDEASYKRNYETAGDWLLLQRLGGDASILGGHAFDDWHSRYGQTHPEWFALQPDGTREQIGGRARLCDANEDLAAEVAKDRLKYAEAHPGAYIPMAPNDGGATNFFCMCPECRKLDPANGPAIELLFGTGPGRSERFMGRYVSLTDRHVTFWNRVAAKVLAVKPTARFTTYAYSAYRDAPLGAPIHPAYSVGFVGLTYLHDGIRKEDLARWDGWAAQSSSLYLRPNLLLQGISYPYNYVGEMARDLAHCYRTGLIGADFDCITHDWATRGLVYYALARLLWNPGLSGTDIVDDYCRTGFGPAAEPVKKYFAELEQATRDMARLSAETETPASGQAREEEIGAPVLTARERMERSLPQAFHAARLDRMTSLLDEAREIARNDPTIGQRVDFLAVGLEYARLQTATYQAQQAGEDPRPALEALREFLRETAEKQPLAINTAYLLYEQNARFRILQ